MPKYFWSFTVFLLLLFSNDLHGDLYQWQDRDGGWHIADDQDKVPPEYWSGMKVREIDEVENPIPKKQTVKTPRTIPNKRFSHPAHREYTVPYKRGRGVFYVNVSINGRDPVPLMMDTGASYTVLSRRLAKELGISLEGILPKIRTSTANGVTENYLVRLSSIAVGDARVENVPALIPVRSAFGGKGVLGQNFLNEFEWSNDTTRGMLTLREPTSLPGEEIYGGHGRIWWERKFESAKEYLHNERKILRVMEEFDSDGPMEENTIEKGMRIQRANVEFFQKELEILDTKANRYMVPRSWR